MLQSFDFFLDFYEKNLALFGDIRYLDERAEQSKWSNYPDFHKILVFKKQAIIIKTISGQAVFTSSNMNSFLMSLLSREPLYEAGKHMYNLEIYKSKPED